jgi:hypothetical protein
MAFWSAGEPCKFDRREGARGRRPPTIGALAALALAVACGRIGFGDGAADAGDVSRDGPLVVDASNSGTTSEDSGDGASGVRGRDATVMESGVIGPDASDAAADAAPCPAAAPIDYCAMLPFLPAPPVIDGAIDCGVALRDLTPVDWSGGATPPDASAQYAVAWRPDGLYFFVRVHDPSLVPADPSEFSWEGDEVELYMDSDGTYTAPPAYDNPGARQITIAAPPDAQSSVARAQLWYPGLVGTIDWTSTQFRAYGLPDGYVVEAFVTGPDLGLSTLTLAAGGRVGMDLSIGVSYPSDRGADAGTPGNRLGQYFLRIADPDAGGGVPPFDPRAFCTPTLSPG